MNRTHLLGLINTLLCLALIGMRVESQPSANAHASSVTPTLSSLTSSTTTPFTVIAPASSTTNVLLDLETIASLLRSSGTPLEDVAVYRTEYATHTAILIPQIHRQPGSNVFDQTNDDAYVTQQEIAAILRFISSRHMTSLVAMEGDPIGDIPSAYLEALRQKAEAARTLHRLRRELVERVPTHASLPDIDHRLETATREIMLEGAGFALYAEGHHLTLIGTENPVTQQHAAETVRRYVYLQDRQTALRSPSPHHDPLARTTFTDASTPLAELLQLMQQRRRARMLFSSPAKEAQPTAQTNQDEQELVRHIHDALDTLQAPLPQKFSPAPAPPREANPYADITDTQEITQRLTDTERDIQHIVIDRRNAETAEAFAQALDAHGVTTGVIQFGAGHTDGLVAQLQRQGLSVIVVTPQHVQAGQKHMRAS